MKKRLNNQCKNCENDRNGTSSYCPPCDKIVHAKRYQANKESSKNAKLIKKFGIDLAQFNKMSSAQKDLCLICKKENGKRSLAVDHDHETNFIRSLLCSPCNSALGFFQDDPILMQRGAAYITIHKEAHRILEEELSSYLTQLFLMVVAEIVPDKTNQIAEALKDVL